MIFVQIICGIRRGEIERAEIHFGFAVFRCIFNLDQQRQTLRATNQRTRFINRAAILNQHRASDRFVFCFKFDDLAGLFFDDSANIRRQSFDGFAHGDGFNGKWRASEGWDAH